LSKRIAFFYTASLLSGAFGGLLAGGIIEGMEGLANTRGWKWLFMIEGIATVVVGAAGYFILPSSSLVIATMTHRADLRLPYDHHLVNRGREKTGYRSTCYPRRSRG